MTRVAFGFCVAAIVLITIVGVYSQPARQHITYPIGKKLATEMIFIHFTPEEKRRIEDEASSMFTVQCTNAFREAKLLPPTEVVLEFGVVFRPSTDLYSYTASELGLLYEQTRKAYALEFSDGRSQAGAIRAARNGFQMTVDGRAHIFLHDTAFYGESFLLGTIPLREVLVHEFIHLGGQPQTFGRLGPLRHDLAGFSHYNRIIEACR